MKSYSEYDCKEYTDAFKYFNDKTIPVTGPEDL
jgi:hypothetical protein